MNDKAKDFLAHHGVKGQKWGVINEDRGKGRSRGSVKLTPKEQEVLKAVGANSDTSKHLQDRYGPGTLDGSADSKKKGLSDTEKKVLKNVAIGVGTAGAAFVAYKLLKKGLDVSDLKAEESALLSEKPALTTFLREHHAVGNSRFTQGLTPEEIGNFGDERLTFNPGHVFRRVSMAKETDIRPDGFFASYKDDDLTRYKAVLPIYWKQWGHKAETGFVVNIKANAEIKAPSPKETYERFKSMLDDTLQVDGFNGKGELVRMNRTVKDLILDDWNRDKFTSLNNDEFAARFFPEFAVKWASGLDDAPEVQHFFNAIKKDGFNALPDMNDRGSLSDSPLRVLDGSLFSIDSHETLTKDAIAQAQELVKTLKHLLIFVGKTLKSFIRKEDKHGVIHGQT